MPAVGEVYIPWRIFVGSIVPNAILRNTELSSTSKLVFARLCQFAGENGHAYPSYKTLGCEVGVEERQAKRAVKELVAFGLIRLNKQYRPDGGSSTNIYEFLWHDIFITGMHSTPGAKHDTGGSVRNVTPSQCHLRHPGVSEVTPKENHSRESNSEKTTTEEIRLLLSGTPLSKISEKEVRILIKRHGSEKVKIAADIAAETWRREHMEIRNPGGYLQAFCVDLIVPEGYEPPHVRAANSKTATERQSIEAQTLAEQQEAEAQVTLERNNYWHSLSEQDRQKHRDDVKCSSPLHEDLKGVILDGMAKFTAWNKRQQMNTNAISSA